MNSFFVISHCNVFQVSAWINEKLQIALDESYRDPTNLQAKLQKHSAFEAELSANRNRVDAIVEVGLLSAQLLFYILAICIITNFHE